MRKVDFQMYSEYERIQKEFNKLRKKVTKTFKVLREENTGGKLPAMAIPQRQRHIPERIAMKMSRREMRRRMNAMYSFVSKGMKGFFKEFKKSYLELYQTYIIEESPELNPFRNSGAGFLYSEEQIKLAFASDPKMAQFMQDYNNIVRMNPERFVTLIYTGKIPEFKKIYQELHLGFHGYESFAEQMHSAISLKGALLRESASDNEKVQEYYSGKKKETSQRMKNVKKQVKEERFKRYLKETDEDM